LCALVGQVSDIIDARYVNDNLSSGRQVVTCARTDGQPDRLKNRHNEANNSFSQFLLMHLKTAANFLLFAGQFTNRKHGTA